MVRELSSLCLLVGSWLVVEFGAANHTAFFGGFNAVPHDMPHCNLFFLRNGKCRARNVLLLRFLLTKIVFDYHMLNFSCHLVKTSDMQCSYSYPFRSNQEKALAVNLELAVTLVVCLSLRTLTAIQRGRLIRDHLASLFTFDKTVTFTYGSVQAHLL